MNSFNYSDLIILIKGESLLDMWQEAFDILRIYMWF